MDDFLKFPLIFLAIVSFHILSHVIFNPPDISFATIQKATSTKNNNKEEEDITIRRKFPTCFADSLFTQDNKETRLAKRLMYVHTMQYELIGKDVSQPSRRYNYMCPWLRNQYNCVSTAQRQYGMHPDDWKLMLKDPFEDEYCNLWDLTQHFEGPSGLGNFLQRQNQKGTEEENNTAQKKTHNVVIFGDSFMRQIFQAFVCGWNADITASSFQEIDARAASNGFDPKITMKELPFLWHPRENKDEQKQHKQPQCDFVQRLQFYDDGLLQQKHQQQNGNYKNIPINCNNYSDDVAMVEFGHSLRIYFMFRPYRYNNNGEILQVFDQMWNGLSPLDMHTLVFSEGEDLVFNINNRIREMWKDTGAWEKRLVWPSSYFQKIQKRDIGKYFSIENKWTSKLNGHPTGLGPDSDHIDNACMPGAPDDHANLLLYLIYTNSYIRDFEAPVAPP